MSVNRNFNNLVDDGSGGGGGGDSDGDGTRRRRDEETDGGGGAADTGDAGAPTLTLEELQDIRAAGRGDAASDGGDGSDTPAVDPESRDPRSVQRGVAGLSPTQRAETEARQEIQENTRATLRPGDLEVRTQETDDGVTAEADLRATGIGREILAGAESDAALTNQGFDAESRDPRTTEGGIDSLSPVEASETQVRQQLQERTEASLRPGDVEVTATDTDGGLALGADLTGSGLRREVQASVESERGLDAGEDFTVEATGDVEAADSVDDFEVNLTDTGRQALRDRQRDDTVVGTVADTAGDVFGSLPGSNVATDLGEAAADTESDLTQPLRSAAGDLGDVVGDAPGVSATVDTVTDAGDTVGDVSSDAATGLQNQVLAPAAGRSARGVELLGQAVNPTTAADDPFDPDTETAPGQALEGVFTGAGRTAADVTAGAPALAIGATQTTGQAVATTSEEIGDDGVLGGGFDAAQAGVSAGVAATADMETSARERPAETAGALLAGPAVGAAGAKAGRLFARRGPDAARRAGDEFRSLLGDERGQFDPASDEQVQITKQRERERESDAGDRLADIQALDRDLEPGEARQVARQQLSEEAGSVDAIAPSQQAREAAIERRAAELQLRLRADRSGLSFDDAVPEGQRFEAIQQTRTRLFDDDTESGTLTDTRTATADADQRQTAAAATLAPDDDGQLAAAAAQPERDSDSDTALVDEAFARPPDDGQQTGLVEARPDDDRETDTAFAAPPRSGQQVGDVLTPGQEVDTDLETVTPAEQREATELLPPQDQQTDTVFAAPEPQTQTLADPTPTPPGGQLFALDREERRPRLPDGGDDPSDGPLFPSGGGSAESPFTNPVSTAAEVLDGPDADPFERDDDGSASSGGLLDAGNGSVLTDPAGTAAEVLSPDAEGGGSTAEDGSSSGLFGGDR